MGHRIFFDLWGQIIVIRHRVIKASGNAIHHFTTTLLSDKPFSTDAIQQKCVGSSKSMRNNTCFLFVFLFLFLSVMSSIPVSLTTMNVIRSVSANRGRYSTTGRYLAFI